MPAPRAIRAATAALRHKLTLDQRGDTAYPPGSNPENVTCDSRHPANSPLILECVKNYLLPSMIALAF